jgi:hypothetical protein
LPCNYFISLPFSGEANYSKAGTCWQGLFDQTEETRPGCQIRAARLADAIARFLHAGFAKPRPCMSAKLQDKSGSRAQDLLNHITIDIVCFQVLDGADGVEFGLNIKAMADNLFLGNIQRIVDGCERR